MNAVDGAITLAGHVMTIHEKHVALRAAECVPAVGAIADEIEVRPSSLHDYADDEIAEEIAHLRGSRAPFPDSVAVQVRDGRVIVHGQVDSVAQRDAAESALRRLAAVHVVDNLITVKSPSQSTADVERRVEEAIGRSIRVTKDDGTVYLHGHVPSLTALRTALHAAATAPGVTAVESEIVVRLARDVDGDLGG